MSSDDPRRRANKILMDMCFRIERMCRYSPLDDKETNDNSISDRNIVAGLYHFYKNHGDNEEQAGQKARANAVRLILVDVLT